VVTKNRTTGEISEQKQILLDYAWWMKKQGYAKQTIQGRTSIINTLLNRQVNIENPESIKEYLASQECSPGRKRNIVHAITAYYKSKGTTWNPPKYHRIPKIPWIPQETFVDQLIAGCPGKYKPFLQILKETGMRPGEAWNLTWNDIDLITKQVRITPEKGSNPRILPISNTLIAMLNQLPRDKEHVFKNGLYRNFSEGFRRHRIKLAKKLGNQDLKRIKFKTLRHFKGTMEYHKTKDILKVKRLLGNNNIKNTLVHTHLIDFKAEEYITKIAENAEEACNLLESGFEYVLTTPNELMVFRKRK
jgi:integrase